jgi:hypothetical protein
MSRIRVEVAASMMTVRVEVEMSRVLSVAT